MIPSGSERTPSPTVADLEETASGWLKRCRSWVCFACESTVAKPSAWPAFVAALFIALVVLTLPSAPPDLGADSGWCAVLNWAHRQGAQFGRDIVFTYGPLGFLVAPYYFGQSAVVLVTANGLLCYLVALGLCLVAWRLAPIWRWVLLGIFAFEAGNVEPRVDLIFETGFLCWGLLCFTETGRRRHWYATAWIALIIFTGLAKVTYLFIGAFSACLLSAYLLLSGSKRAGIALLPCFAGALALAWMGSGQAISNFGLFLMRGFLVSRGYDQAAGLEGLPMLRTTAWILGGLALAAILLQAPGAGDSAERFSCCRRACTVGWLLGLLFVVWKHSMVRVDRYHTIELAVFAPVLALGLEMLPHKHTGLRWSARGLALITCLLSVQFLKSTFLPDLASACRGPLQQFAYHFTCLAHAGDWTRAFERPLDELRNLAQLPKIKSLVGAASLDVFGSQQAYALLNELNYQPRPVFQSYAAYSEPLARVNEQFYLFDRAPDYVLFELSAPEHRFPALNDSLALRALLINYQPVAGEGPFLLLKRRTKEAAHLTLLQEGEVPVGQRIDLSHFAGANLWLELDLRPALPGRVAQWLTRPPTLRLAAWDGPRLIARERAATPLLRIGFLASPCLLNSGEVRRFYEGKPTTTPSAYSLELAPHTEGFWRPTVPFRLYRIENARAPTAAGE